ncbi:MAG: hypothetical protein QOK78_05910 [Nitrososphaeraceae archaeon]|nr:hypothetical protein [Nitrososphaeraceae archaeon]
MRTSYELWLVLLFDDFTAFHIARNALYRSFTLVFFVEARADNVASILASSKVWVRFNRVGMTTAILAPTSMSDAATNKSIDFIVRR